MELTLYFLKSFGIYRNFCLLKMKLKENVSGRKITPLGILKWGDTVLEEGDNRIQSYKNNVDL